MYLLNIRLDILNSKNLKKIKNYSYDLIHLKRNTFKQYYSDTEVLINERINLHQLRIASFAVGTSNMWNIYDF